MEDSKNKQTTANGKIFTYEDEVVGNKQLRKDMDDIVQRMKQFPYSKEREISLTRLNESMMWLGMDLKRLGETNPYPNSKDPGTGTIIDPTADGLKM